MSVFKSAFQCIDTVPQSSSPHCWILHIFIRRFGIRKAAEYFFSRGPACSYVGPIPPRSELQYAWALLGIHIVLILVLYFLNIWIPIVTRNTILGGVIIRFSSCQEISAALIYAMRLYCFHLSPARGPWMRHVDKPIPQLRPSLILCHAYEIIVHAARLFFDTFAICFVSRPIFCLMIPRAV